MRWRHKRESTGRPATRCYCMDKGQELICRVGGSLSQHMNEFEHWEYEGNVGMINAVLMQCIQRIAATMLTSVPDS
eukprot:8307959-Pyramimonas_sp.AAC.1